MQLIASPIGWQMYLFMARQQLLIKEEIFSQHS
jgi:hypothetical protein